LTITLTHKSTNGGISPIGLFCGLCGLGSGSKLETYKVNILKGELK